jgi:hypothetical protein
MVFWRRKLGSIRFWRCMTESGGHPLSRGLRGKALRAATGAILARAIALRRPIKCAFSRLTTVFKD